MKNPFKTNGNLRMCIFLLCFVHLCISSCINNIDEVDNGYHEGTIPITFSGKVTKITQTRVSDKALELGDEVGLMAMISGVPVSGKRYIDNLLLTTSSENALIPKDIVYYPEGEDAKLDFIAYYPYLKEGISLGDSKLKVQVQKNQLDEKKRDLSDFLVATKSKVGASKESVLLSFKHKLAKVKVELIINNANIIDDLLESNPGIKACGFFTQATYDFATDEFSNPSEPAVITFSGDWKKSKGKLVGKEMIVVPQNILPDSQYLVLEINGKLYTCQLSASSLKSNSQRVISISFNEAVDNTLSGFVGEVQSWDEGAIIEEQTESSYQMTKIQTELLSFNQSNIYHIYNNGRLLGELCKEYLRLPDNNIDSQALVFYPVKDFSVDLTKGTVLELLDVAEDIHGGKIQWDVQTKTVNYTAGTSKAIKAFYINESGDIVFEKPVTPLSVHVKTYELRDIRGKEVAYYGLVKIGTQYWMRENLAATMYVDGTKLQQQSNDYNLPYYLMASDGKNVLYNNKALTSGNLVSNGWRIPKVSDWETLVHYVGEVAALKVGTWSLLQGVEGVLAPVTNKAMFYGKPVGIWFKKLDGEGAMTLFWSMDEDGVQLAPKAFGLIGNFSDLKLINTQAPTVDYSKCISLRLLRP